MTAQRLFNCTRGLIYIYIIFLHFCLFIHPPLRSSPLPSLTLESQLFAEAASFHKAKSGLAPSNTLRLLWHLLANKDAEEE